MSKKKKYKVSYSSDRSQEYLDGLDAKETEFQQFKQDMKTVRISTQDKNDIGMLSSGWQDFLKTLKPQFEKSRKAGHTRADHVSKFWNDIGFKTASGKSWSPRLVNIAKDKVGIKHGFVFVYD